MGLFLYMGHLQDNRCMSEAQEQETVIQYCDLKQIPVYHVPNGGYRNAREGARLKAQGVKPGVPDLCIPVARSGFHGLYIEMKTETGKPSKAQTKWINTLRDEGYCAYVCRDVDAAINLIDRYMSNDMH